MSIKQIEDGVYCIQHGSTEWIMAPGVRHICGVGICGNTAWFMTRKGGFDLFDIPARHHLKRAHVGSAWSPSAWSEGFYIQAKASLNGRHIYIVRATGPYTRRLDVMDARDGRIIARHSDLPGGIQHTMTERTDGQLLMPASGRFIGNQPDPDGHDGSGTLKLGFILVDPKDGLLETDLQEGDDWIEGRFHSPSPNGQYWLKRDPCTLPIMDVPETRGPKTIFGQRKSTRYYGRSVQIWETQPLRFVRRVTVAWLTMQETPDNGHVDNIQSNRSLSDIKRGYQYDRLACLLEKKNLGLLDYIDMADFGDPNVHHSKQPTDKRWSGLSKNYAEFCSIDQLHIHGWSGNEAFWVQTNGFLTCVGVDGVTSPRLFTERFGLESSAWLPVAKRASTVHPLPDRKARVTYYDKGTVVFDDSKQAERTAATYAIPESQDQWAPSEPYTPPSKDPRITEAHKLLDKRKTVTIKLQSMDDTNCIAAIDQLTAQLDDTLATRARDGEIAIIFQHGRKTLREDKFFAHILNACPEATQSLDALLRRYVNVTDDWDFLYFKADKGVGLLAHAAFTLGLLDGRAVDTLRLYARRIDHGHEYFFCNKTLPAIIDKHGHTSSILRLAIWVMLFRSGNSIDPEAIWGKLGVRQALRDTMQLSEAVELFRSVLKDDGPSSKDLDTLSANDFLGGIIVRLAPSGDQWSRDFFEAVMG